MFVLRSHEVDSDSAPRTDTGHLRVVPDAGDSARGEEQDFPADGQSRGRDEDAAPISDAAAASARTTQAGPPHGASMQIPLFAAAFAVRFGGRNAAAECPKHLADVQALINTVVAGADRARDRMPPDRAALVHALLDDARMLLEAARQNHERPQGPYDHARAFAKADVALGHARAAQIVYSRSVQR